MQQTSKMPSAKEAISVTERKDSAVYEWLASNPSGFGLWFDDINRKFLDYDRQVQREKVFKQYRDIFQMNAMPFSQLFDLCSLKRGAG